MKKYLAATRVSLIVSSFLSLLFVFGFFSTWRTKMTDKLFLNKELNQNIVIVAIDNESLQKIGRWPWERSKYASLIDKISENKPLLIGLDIIFPEKSSLQEDASLAQAIKNSGNVILPIEAELKIDKEKINISKLLYSIDEIQKSSFDSGLTNTPADSDGIFRKIPLFVEVNNQQIKSFAGVIASRYFDFMQKEIPQIPIDEKNRMLINYQGSIKTFTSIPAYSIFENNFDKNILKDKIVLIGSTASDLHDEQIVPTSGNKPMSGVEIHANAINTIISKNFLKPINIVFQIILFLILSLLVSFAVARFKTFTSLIISFFVLLIYLISALLLFDKGLVFDLFFVFLIVVFSYLAVIIEQHIYEVKEKNMIKGAFSRYVSLDVINELLKNPTKLKLGGEKKELTILFSDIRSFTSISEKLSPEELVELLNKYLSKMTDIIMESGGVVDKYIGDAIMAFWGAPLRDNKHAKHSCQSALLMIKTLNNERQNWQENFSVELNIGVGINTGEVIIGNMGSEKRFDYTVMGDSVNLASRLEGITKQYGVEIVVSETTFNQAGDDFVFRYLDTVAVKGKKEGVKIYELICFKQDLQEDVIELIKKFNQGIDFYQKQKWGQAINIFENILKEYPKDGPSKVFLDRCQILINNDFDETWDGIYRLTTK